MVLFNDTETWYFLNSGSRGSSLSASGIDIMKIYHTTITVGSVFKGRGSGVKMQVLPSESVALIINSDCWIHVHSHRVQPCCRGSNSPSCWPHCVCIMETNWPHKHTTWAFTPASTHNMGTHCLHPFFFFFCQGNMFRANTHTPFAHLKRCHTYVACVYVRWYPVCVPLLCAARLIKITQVTHV